MKTKNSYLHPFQKGTLTLAVTNEITHSGAFKHAIDFLLDYNIPILAGAKGKVIEVKDDSDKGGLDEKFKDAKNQNYITIQHANNELSQYVHIAQNSALVKIGEQIMAGQPIAQSIGMVGYTGAPHIHLIVFALKDNKDGFESLEIRWRDYKSKIYTGEGLIKQIQKPRYKKLVRLIIENKK
ncbi:M23 family metallopeptidase [Candidatus Woesearchaeota archaeon]|nr:M23 family metallopeptidase [Candidatus Woesearchaeota archaeon]